MQQKKNVWEIAIIEQIKWREETMIIRLGSLKQNLELKHMFIICS